MKTKKCSNKICENPIKPVSEFSKDKSRKDGLYHQCKGCVKKYQLKNKEKFKYRKKKYYNNNKEKFKKYREENKLKISERMKKWRFKNKDTISNTNKKYNLENKEQIVIRNKKYKSENKDTISIKVKEYQLKNKDTINKQRNKREKERKQIDINYKILCNLRNRLNKVLKRNQRSESTKELLGCSINQLKEHLESQFTDEMNWNNHSVCGWHIDHIKPCASFDLSKPEQQRECFHYTNLQPLWAEDNLKKGSKVVECL